MNDRIRGYFDLIEARLIESPAITSFQIIRKEISLTDGKLRVKSTLSDSGVFECFLYVRETGQSISLEKYSLHWQARQGNLVLRRDNAPHFSGLPCAPHHEHTADTVRAQSSAADIFTFLDNIEKGMASS